MKEEEKMKKCSPCINCERVRDPENCENKTCKQWSQWFLEQWEQIHGYYMANAAGVKEERK